MPRHGLCVGCRVNRTHDEQKSTEKRVGLPSDCFQHCLWIRFPYLLNIQNKQDTVGTPASQRGMVVKDRCLAEPRARFLLRM